MLPTCAYPPKPCTGLSADESLAVRKQFLNPASLAAIEWPSEARAPWSAGRVFHALFVSADVRDLN